MRDQGRIKRILSLLEKKWMEYPDMRFYQFLHAFVLSKVPTIDWFYVEDDKLESILTEENRNERGE